MNETGTILRSWSGRIRTEHEAEYVQYLEQTVVKDFESTPGHLGHQLLIRTLRDGISEITALSWWRDMEAVRAFAGPRAERSRYYPEDGRYLLGRTELVEHHRLFSNTIRLTNDP